MVEYSAYVGLDVHKETIAVAVAAPGREDPVFRGVIRNQRSSLRRLVGRLSPDGGVLSFAYEAGPCGHGVYRELVATGHDCMVPPPPERSQSLRGLCKLPIHLPNRALSPGNHSVGLVRAFQFSGPTIG